MAALTTQASPPAINKKTAIVTGANSGIGFEVAARLVQGGHHAVLACRRSESCETARRELLKRHPEGSCECMDLDLSDFASVRQFAQDFQARHPGERVRVLVNNAATIDPSGLQVAEMREGEDPHLVTNHYGPYLLSRLMLPLMAAKGRLITVGSESHRRASLKVAHVPDSVATGAVGTPANPSISTSASTSGGFDVTGPIPTHWYQQYGRSKLGNLLMTAELAKRLRARGSTVTTTCVSPGRVFTGIFRHLEGPVGVAMRSLAWAFFSTPQRGAKMVMKAVDIKVADAKKDSPLYMHESKAIKPSAAALDPALAAALWEASTARVGLTPEEDEELWPKQ